MCPDTCYTDCFFSDDGLGVTYNDRAFPNGSNYAPAVIGNVTTAFIRAALQGSSFRQPFFAYVAPHSPHSPATPAPWYAETFKGERAPRTASYNVPAPDHHWAVAVQPKILPLAALSMDRLARARLQTLLTVDDTMRTIAAVLAEHDATDNTFVMFTSDHGFHIGQHCLGACKRQPYDTDIRVPLLVRGPGISAGSVVQALAGIPDLAPTILALAARRGRPATGSGASAGAGARENAAVVRDGESLLPLLLPAFPAIIHTDGRGKTGPKIQAETHLELYFKI